MSLKVARGTLTQNCIQTHLGFACLGMLNLM